jgi:anti-anti-sigma regulatory factor
MVTSVDAGIVQVLLAARRSVEQAGREFCIIAEAESALPDTLSRLGIAHVQA